MTNDFYRSAALAALADADDKPGAEKLASVGEAIAYAVLYMAAVIDAKRETADAVGLKSTRRT